MATSKGKQSERQALVPPLPNPATGSANPAASLSSLWAYLLPALNHIVKSPTNNISKAPAIDVEFYSGIHSACYNYITAQTENYNSRKNEDSALTTGTDLYGQLDKYFADTVRELLLGAPQDDSSLIDYIIPCFNRYSAGAQSVNRLLNYVNRHYVKRAVDEDKGWLSINDVLEHVARTITVNDTREKLSNKLKEKRLDELKKWGYSDGDPAEALILAESCAEAASSLDRIIPIASLAHRRFRVEFVEPLLAVPKVKRRGKNKPLKTPNRTTPKGRLARAVKELLESREVDEDERSRIVGELALILRKIGVVGPLRKRLDKYSPFHSDG
ncbi:Cullin repeat-like-containing domain protein [Desarmillaria ectypa]|nr:Cullin repeat-like-containing domain protein [Desarmillaria ectypa]